MHKLFSIFSLILFAITVTAQPVFNTGHDPKPENRKWVLVNSLSDEFNGVVLDESKWKNTDPVKWIGRAPAIFKKDVVTVRDGNLQLTVYQMSTPEIVNGKTWTHAGGYVASKSAAQVGYYFEARMKANKTFMSSTFWLINDRGESSGCDVRTTELDIQECIGQITTSQSWAQNKYREMGSNTHSRNKTCAETPEGSKGGNIDIGAPAYNDYHIYAAWWKSATEILFFLDGKHIYTVKPVADFNLPMYLRMVCETYDWNPVPADGGMKGTAEERTTSYDWVRTWKLEDKSTSIKESKINSLNIYPNPVFDKITLDGIESGTLQASIVDIRGVIVKDYGKSTVHSRVELNTSELNKGLYFLCIQNEKINQVFRFVRM